MHLSFTPKTLFWLLLCQACWPTSYDKTLSPPTPAVQARAPEGKEVLASGQSYPCSLALDESSVYWTNCGSTRGAVVKRDKAGGEPVILAADQIYPAWLALDETSLYWLSASTSQGALLKMDKAGGKPVTLASGLFYPRTLALGEESVYFATGRAGYTIYQVARSGGPLTTLVSTEGSYSSIHGLAVDGQDLYWLSLESGPSAVVWRLREGQKKPEALATSEGTPQGFALYKESVYWTTSRYDGQQFDGRLYKADKQSGAVTVLAEERISPTALVPTDHALYWLETVETATLRHDIVVRSDKQGRQIETLVSAYPQLSALAVDESGVYWATLASASGKGPNQGTIMRHSPKEQARAGSR